MIHTSVARVIVTLCILVCLPFLIFALFLVLWAKEGLLSAWRELRQFFQEITWEDIL